MKDFILTTNKITKKFGKNFQILTEGIDTSRFEKNPIMLFNHDVNNVIGTWTNLRKEGDKLIATPNFDDDPDSDKIRNKVEKGTLKTASIGLGEPVIEETEDMYIVKSSVLWETSIVSIPQNDEAEVNNIIILNSLGQQVDLKEYIKNNNNNMENKDEKVVEQIVIDNVVETPVIENTIIDTTDYKMVNVELTLKVDNLNVEIEMLKNSIAERDTRISNMDAKLKEYEKQKFETLLNDAVSNGKITNESKNSFEGLSYEQTEKILNSLKPQSASLLNELNKQKTINQSVNKDYFWYLKNDKEGLRKMSIENPVQYKELEKRAMNK